MIKAYRAACVAIIIISLSSYVAAQNQHPNQARGFNANGVYSNFDIDHINTFNGNLLVTIPIGQKYPLNANLSYSLNLIYNSYAWSPREVCPDTIDQTLLSSVFYSLHTRWVVSGGQRVPIGESVPIQPPSNGDDYGPGPARSGSDQCRTIQDPNPAANAGLGWQVTMGRLYQPRVDVFDDRANYTEKSEWVYMAPDGSEHTFYRKLHNDDPDGGSQNIWYTRDNSYLRLNFNPPPNSYGNTTIEFPDGTKQYFTPVRIRVAAGGLPEIIARYVSRIEDQFGNFVNVQYLDTNGDTLPDDKWVITDSLGRTQTLIFASPRAGYPKAVSQIILEAFGGQSATYSFQYEPRTIIRPAPHVPPGLISGYDDNVKVNFLTAVNLPDGSKYAMPFESSYFIPTGDHYSPGMLQKVTLPTGGSIQWAYESEDPQGDLLADVGYHFGLASSARHYVRSSIGVRRRTLTEGPNTYVWRYDPKLGSVFPSGCSVATAPNTCAPAEFVNTVTNPQGDHTRYYFSVWPFPYDTGSQAALRRGLSDLHSADYALPFTKDPRRAEHDPVKTYNDSRDNPLFLSQATYDSAWRLKRSVYLRYETDAIDPGDGFGSMRDANSRVVASRTVYDDDGTYAEAQYSDFDGLGHYRKTAASSSFGTSDSRLDVTNYNRDADGSYHIYYVDPTTNQAGVGHNYTAFSEDRPWLLDLYDSKSSSDYVKRSTTYFQFDEQGRLLAKRTRKAFETNGSNYSLGNSDVLVQYGYDANGNVASESYFGGDRAGHPNLDTSNRFPALNDANSEYRINYEHQCVGTGNEIKTIGLVSSTAYRGANFKNTNDTIDCRTGLVKTGRDTAGVWTSYDYNNMGRLIYITRQQGHHDLIQYQPFTNGPLARATVTQLDRNNPSPNTGTLGQQIYIYDQLGRLITEKKLMPGGSYLVRSTGYNAMSWVTSVSEWSDGATNAGRKTSYDNFDPFGRATKITTPDGKVTFMDYQGVRQIKRTTNIAGQLDAGGTPTEQSSVTQEIYDSQERVVQVIEPAGPAEQNITWNYSYNVNNKLTGVNVTDPSGAASQARTFVYDNLNNLLSQSLPERPLEQSGEYDTQGHAGRSNDGTHTLSYAYDNAARPITVHELVQAPSTWRPVKEYSYYPAGGAGTGGAFGLGKLTSSTRHNYVLNPYETHTNVAVGKPATQSSNFASNTQAALAVDNNTNGAWGGNSLSHTNNDPQAWWQVDLGASYSLDQINLWNRSDSCCSTRLSNFYVLVSDQPFVSQNLTTARNQPGVTSYYFAGTAGRLTTITVGRSARYVRVQLVDTNYLSLAEVQVIGSNPAVTDIAVKEGYTYSGVDGRMSKRTTSTNVANGPSFEQTFAYDQQGNLSSQTYPKCTNNDCTLSTGAQRPWTVNYGYTTGLLTSIGGGAGEGNTTAGTYASALTYNLNGTVATVTHRNNVVDRMALDPNFMPRARQITATLGANTILDTGVFSYDGAGNVKKIGNDWYLYDKVNRLKEGTALLAPGDPLKRLKQTYEYDAFGNRTITRTYNGVSPTAATLKDTYATNVVSATNQLALSYDNAGNVLGAPGQTPTYTYDAFNMIVTAPGLTYIYGPNEERLWLLDTKQDADNSNNEETLTLRGLNKEVLREYRVIGGSAPGRWSWQKDYIYRGGPLLAAETPLGVRHYHVDQLGSPRLITDANGAVWERMQFLPFGENSGFYQGTNEFWSLTYSGEPVPTRLRFTGHEKDSDSLGLDYMHARYYWERNGKFMSVDPGRDWEAKTPQSWNLYAYARNNPLRFIDPNGKAPIVVSSSDTTVMSLLIRTAMRPEGRNALTEIVQSGVLVEVKQGDVPDDPGQTSFGYTGGSYLKATGALTEIDTTIDVDDILSPVQLLPNGQTTRSGHPKDPSGLWTMGHELKHVVTLITHIREIVSGQTTLDKLDHDTGAADAAGKQLTNEHPDKTWDAAKDWLNQNNILDIHP